MNVTSASENKENSAARTVPADDATHLLVVDDDARIRKLLSRYLVENGFRVSVAADAAEARRRLAGLAFDLMILDVMMPGESGMELTESLRHESDVPILMLTARSETENRIRGLELGADDYLPKPFEPRELLLRINNILKRGLPSAPPAITQVRFGPFQYDANRRELRRGGQPIRLTDRERELLSAFAARPGETIPRQDLTGNDGTTSERTIDVQINRLRRKIEPDPTNPVYLQTVRGIGYRLVSE